MRQDAGIDGDAQRIGQLTWLLFLKIFDDREFEAELLDAGYRSPIPDELRWRRWAKPEEGITGDELLDFVNNQLFPTLKVFAESATPGRATVIGNVFQDAFNYMKNGTLIRQVLNKINKIDFNRSEDRHLFADIYEQILKDLQSAGNSGEYYTPRAVTQFMVDMVNPKLGEAVLDPACGTGGFLTCAIEHIRSNDVKTPADEATLQSSVRGVEKKQLPHLLCTTNMLLHGVDVPTNIAHDNTLARPLRDYASKDRVDVIITNPPFGGTEEPGIENNFPQAYRTRETADLFLVLIEHLLVDGGRAAVVLPDGTLFGDGVKARIKEKLLTTCNLHTVVRLPKGVFNPYTGISTNVLFFTKGEPTTDIWYYEHQYPTGYKNYSKTKPIRIEEFDAEKAWWTNRIESEFSWKTSLDEVRANGWNLDRANPNKVGPEYRDPAVLLKECETLDHDIDTTRTCLRDTLVVAIDDGLKANREAFRKSFSHVTEAAGGIDTLRRLIRGLAVRGKLALQDSADEPASELLKRIANERADLVKAREIRKPKALAPVLQSDIPYSVPSGWQWTRIGTIFSMQAGTGVAAGTIRESGMYPCYGGNGIRGYVEFFNRDGDYPIIGRQGALCGNIKIAHGKFYATEHAVVVRCIADTSVSWAALALEALNLNQYATATAQPGLSVERISSVLIPVPPVEEQHRIVERVDDLLGLCDQLEAQQAAQAAVRVTLMSATLHQLLN